MIVLEWHDVEVDYCVACRGIWLDAGELELLFGDRAVTADFLTSGDPSKAAGEQRRRCPICGKGMDKAVTGGETSVVYDRCPRGHGLWFDHGELATVLEHGSTTEGGAAVVSWLRDMFRDSPGAPIESE